MITSPATAKDFAIWAARARTMTISMLDHCIADCRAAAEAMRDWNPDREGYYSDQASTYADERRRRLMKRGH